MVSSNVEICNLAISHLGIGREIADLADEKSQVANVCRTFFPTVRDAVLRDFPWGFSKKIAALGLVENQPNIEWLYSYRYPVDCIHARRLLSGIRRETETSIIRFTESQDEDGTLIFTDQALAELEYTARIEDPLRFPPDFALALSFRLAGYIAPRIISSGDSFRLGERAFSLYVREISKARANAANEEALDHKSESDFIIARES